MNCRGCSHLNEDCVASYFGGMYWSNYCDYEIHRLKLVDADASRECWNFKKQEEEDSNVSASRQI